MRQRIYYPGNLEKRLLVAYNFVILGVGLLDRNGLVLVAVVLASLLGSQEHFQLFEDTRDTNWANRGDLLLIGLTLIVLCGKFFWLTGGR